MKLTSYKIKVQKLKRSPSVQHYSKESFRERDYLMKDKSKLQKTLPWNWKTNVPPNIKNILARILYPKWFWILKFMIKIGFKNEVYRLLLLKNKLVPCNLKFS